MHSPCRRFGLIIGAGVAAALVAGGCGAIVTPTRDSAAPGRPPPAAGASIAGPTESRPKPAASPTVGAGRSGTSPPASAGPAGSPASSPSPTPRPLSPNPAPAAPLPRLVASIGDSISVGYNAAPAQFGPQPSHSWVVGTDPSDGIESHLERLRALGADPAVLLAARAGARMSDFVRQARLVVADAGRLRPGETAYVTIELGANDLCGDDLAQVTPAADFGRELSAGLTTLVDGTTISGKRVAGLPPGSKVLVLSVPDVLALRRLVRSDPLALAIHEQFGQCRAAVEAHTESDLRSVKARIDAFDASIHAACAAIERTSATRRVSCRDDQGAGESLTAARFTLADLSRIDYFHPSLLGQARIADGSWAAGFW